MIVKIILSKSQWQSIGQKAGWHNKVKCYNKINKIHCGINNSSLAKERKEFDAWRNSVNSAYEIAKKLNFNLSRIPQEVINKIAECFSASYMFARSVKFDLTKIPQEFINRIATHEYLAYDFMKAVKFDFTKIPKEFFNSLTKDTLLCRKFIKDMKFDFTKIPQIIMDAMYREAIHKRDVSSLFFFIAIECKCNMKILPEKLIDIISTDVNYCYKWAQYVDFDSARIPQKIIDSISKSSIHSYGFAHGAKLNWEKIPSNIIQTIKKSLENQ